MLQQTLLRHTVILAEEHVVRSDSQLRLAVEVVFEKVAVHHEDGRPLRDQAGNVRHLTCG